MTKSASPFEILRHTFHQSETGGFVELARRKEIPFHQVSLCVINPGCERGGHYHRRKEEWFGVVQGEMVLRFEWDGEFREIKLSAKDPVMVHIPKGVRHVVTNPGREICKFVILANEEFDPEDPDTFSG